jgi:isopentenyl phosphate kinase
MTAREENGQGQIFPDEPAVARVVLVKFGGSLLTDKAGDRALRHEVMARLAQEVASVLPQLRQRGCGLILGHGSGSFGHRAAVDVGYDPADPGDKGRSPSDGATIRRAALELHSHVLEALCAAGLPAFSFPPASFLLAREGELELAAPAVVAPLRSALAQGYLPVVFGDVVIDSSSGFTIASTESVFLQLVRALSADLEVRVVLWFGETDGVLEAGGKTLPRLQVDQQRPQMADARGSDVTGGMVHRLDSAYELARDGVPSRLLNGLSAGAVERALLDAVDEPSDRVGELDRGSARANAGTWIEVATVEGGGCTP